MLELDLDEERGSTVQAVLKKLTGRGTVPSIWIGGRFVGGSDEIWGMDKRGELKGLLEGAGAI